MYVTMSLRPLTHHFKNGQRGRQGHGHVDGRLQPFVALMKYLLVDDAQGRQNPNNPVELDWPAIRVVGF